MEVNLLLTVTIFTVMFPKLLMAVDMGKDTGLHHHLIQSMEPFLCFGQKC